MLIPNRKQRPSDQVMAYMNTALLSASDTEKPIRMPSVRQLAAHLGVSPSTVATVYQSMKKEGLMLGAAGSGTFLTMLRNNGIQKHIRLTINLPPAAFEEDGGWAQRIIGGLTVAALKTKCRLTIQSIEDILSMPFSNTPHTHDAALIFPYDKAEQLIAWAKEYRLPMIHLNPPTENTTENFVSADYFGATLKLGHALRLAGRKHILVVNDRAFHKSTSNRLRVSGLLAGLEYGDDPKMACEFVFTHEGITQDAGRKALSEYIEKSRRYPDAIYSPGDFIALGCLEEMNARGIPCPDQVSIIGGTGLNLNNTNYPQLTRISHPFEEIGNQLTTVLMDQIAHPHHTAPGKFVPMSWLGNATTTSQENSLLFQN